jgi:hypothetical protein
MKITTNERELGCLLQALNGLKPEGNHSNRKRKIRAFEQLGLEKLEEKVLPGGAYEKTPLMQWPVAEVAADIEAGVKDYLIEKFGGDGEVFGGAFIERTVARFIDRLRKLDDEKPAEPKT